jgi:hypothetical protein
MPHNLRVMWRPKVTLPIQVSTSGNCQNHADATTGIAAKGRKELRYDRVPKLRSPYNRTLGYLQSFVAKLKDKRLNISAQADLEVAEVALERGDTLWWMKSKGAYDAQGVNHPYIVKRARIRKTKGFQKDKVINEPIVAASAPLPVENCTLSEVSVDFRWGSPSETFLTHEKVFWSTPRGHLFLEIDGKQIVSSDILNRSTQRWPKCSFTIRQGEFYFDATLDVPKLFNGSFNPYGNGQPVRRGKNRKLKKKQTRAKRTSRSSSGVTIGKKFELNEVRITNLIPPEWRGWIKSTMYGSLASVSVNSFMSDAFNMSGLGSAKQLLGSVLSNQTTDISQLRSMYDRYRVSGIKLRLTIQSELKLAMKVVAVPTNQVAPLQSPLIVPYSTQPGALTRLLGTLTQANRSATTFTLDINFQKFYGTKQYVLTDGNFTGNTNPSGVPTSPLNSFFLMIGGFEPSGASYAGFGNIIIDLEMVQYITFFERTEQSA